MPWNGGSFPDGAKNLPDNRVGIADNFSWIDLYMPTDHIWDDSDANKNGHHSQAALVTKGASPGITVPTSTDGILYVQTISDEKPAAAGSVNKEVLYYADKDGDAVTTHRPLNWGSVWAQAVFNPKTVNAIGSADTTGIIRSSNIASVGYNNRYFEFTFSENAPTSDYIVLGSITRATGSATASREMIAIRGFDGAQCTTSSFQIVFNKTTDVPVDQIDLSTTQAFVVVIV